MRYKIPKTFELMGLTWKVIYQDDLLETKKEYGNCCSDTSTITLQSLKSKRITREVQYATFHHELVHAYLFSLHYLELAINEGVVDRLGQIRVQFEKSAKY